MKVVFWLNGKMVEHEAEANKTLLDLLRIDLGQICVKKGCGIGECGACTVLLDEQAVLSCLTLSADVDGKKIETIEGVAKGDDLDVVQAAFLEEGAVQCGFCTPGFIMTSKALLNERPNPTEDEIREYLKGNLCRCTGYVNIVKAVKNAAEKTGELIPE